MAEADTTVAPAAPRAGLGWPWWLASAVAALLLLAAGLKAHQLATQPLPPGGWLENRWLLLAAIEWELLLAGWLLSGAGRRLAWLAGALTFVGFLGLTLWRALRGESSCGCFGVIEVNPWITLALDATVLGLLIRFRPRGVEPGHVPSSTWPVKRLVVAALGVLAAGSLAAVAVVSYEPARLGEGGEIVGTDRFVVLDPLRWTGKPFPLAAHVKLAQPFMQGSWVLVLHRHDCQHCLTIMPKLGDLLRKQPAGSQVPRVAAIEMAPYATAGNSLAMPAAAATSAVGSASTKPAAPLLQGRLSDARDWFVATPLVVVLRDGLVLMAEEQANLPLFEEALVTAATGKRPAWSTTPDDRDAPPPCCDEDEDEDDSWFWELEAEAATPLVPVTDSAAVHDFGAVRTESVHLVVFTVTNAGPAPLKITGLRSECSCLLGRPERRVVAPGTTMRVLVGFKAPKAPVRYQRRLLLTVEDGPPLVLAVRAEVKRH